MTPYRLVVGDRAPVQHTATTCGAASLTVARQLADPGFATWVASGVAGTGRSFLPELASADERFAAAEELVIRRTNRLRGPGGGLQLPWPRALGTPPWGARHELEHGGSLPGTAYETVWCRARPASRRATLALLPQRVAAGRPAALYIGDRWSPRHVTLVIASAATGPLGLYDPAVGQVLPMDQARFVDARLAVAGWDVPWCVVLPAA